jgi:hypothetical protein
MELVLSSQPNNVMDAVKMHRRAGFKAGRGERLFLFWNDERENKFE